MKQSMNFGYSWLRTSWLASALWLWSWGGAGVLQAAEPQPGEAHRLTVTTNQGPVEIVFRFCPAGTIKPGMPKPGESQPEGEAGGGFAAILSGDSRISPFYLSETEVTIDQFAKIVGPERFQALQERNRTINSGSPDLIDRLESGGDYPVFMLTIEDVVDFCHKLSALTLSKNDGSSIEGRRFRIPSHVEWQYACRAVQDADAINQLPHFNRWPDGYEALDKDDRGRCLDEWEQMGRDINTFRGDQFQVAEILDTRQSFDNDKPLKILSAFMKAELGTTRDYSVARPGDILPVRSASPNAWNIHDMHVGVREWTLAIRDAGEIQQVWDHLIHNAEIPQDERERKMFFLAGGSFNFVMTVATGAWKEFTIWGGYPMDYQSGQPTPFSYAEADERGYTDEQLPGLRLVMERILLDDWLLVVRRDVVLNEEFAADQLAKFDTHRTVVKEVVPETRQAAVLARLDYYEALANYRLGQPQVTARQLADTQRTLFAQNTSEAAKPQVSVADLLSSPKTAPASPPESKPPTEDELYYSLLQELVAADGAQQ